MLNKHGILRENPVKWFKRNSLLLSRETHTGLEFWLSQTIRGLDSWITEYNAIIEEQKKGVGNGNG